jgi:hypothetical protein
VGRSRALWCLLRRLERRSLLTHTFRRTARSASGAFPTPTVPVEAHVTNPIGETCTGADDRYIASYVASFPFQARADRRKRTQHNLSPTAATSLIAEANS